MSARTIRAVVDRIEDNLAVVMLGESYHVVTWPIKYLPEGVSEGSVLEVLVREDCEATEAAKADVDELIDRLSCEE